MPLVPEQYRELLQKVDLEGNDADEVAAKLGVTRNNLTVRLDRARKHLRKPLTQYFGACSVHGCVDCSCVDGSEAEAGAGPSIVTTVSPIANIVGVYNMLVFGKHVPFRTVPELIEQAKKNLFRVPLVGWDALPDRRVALVAHGPMDRLAARRQRETRLAEERRGLVCPTGPEQGGHLLDTGGAGEAKRIPAVGGTWQLEGPTNVGGRITGLAVDPTRPDTVYAAAASGGVWKSTDRATTFSSVWPHDYPQAIGAVLAEPAPPTEINTTGVVSFIATKIAELIHV